MVADLRHVVFTTMQEYENRTKFDFVVSSCFCLLEFSRHKSENTKEKVRQYDTYQGVERKVRQ